MMPELGRSWGNLRREASKRKNLKWCLTRTDGYNATSSMAIWRPAWTLDPQLGFISSISSQYHAIPYNTMQYNTSSTDSPHNLIAHWDPGPRPCIKIESLGETVSKWPMQASVCPIILPESQLRVAHIAQSLPESPQPTHFFLAAIASSASVTLFNCLSEHSWSGRHISPMQFNCNLLDSFEWSFC